MSDTEICPISGDLMDLAFSETILDKYKINYYFCPKSGLLKTEKPYWLKEAYRSAIADVDVGLVQRNIDNSNWLEPFLQLVFRGEGKFLDVAGGYGLLTRLMRDKGFDFYTTDRYCQNLFASTFEPSHAFKADALFAFEVLEHLEDPLTFLKEIFQEYQCKTLVFSTLTFSGDQIPPKDWWYYSFETGQHITFYQPRTLSYLAELCGLHYYALSSGMHLMIDRQLSQRTLRFLCNQRLRKLYSFFLKRKRRGMSKIYDDYLLIKKLGKEKVV